MSAQEIQNLVWTYEEDPFPFVDQDVSKQSIYIIYARLLLTINDSFG